MKNITNKGFLEYVKANFDLPAEYVEKCDAMIAQLDKNANREKKPTARQDENEVLKADVVAYLSSGVHASVSEMIKAVPSLAGLSTQRVSALCRLLKLESKVDKEMVKGKTLFFLI